MGDYIFNLLLSMSSYIVAAIAVVIIGRFIKPIARVFIERDTFIDNLGMIATIRKRLYVLAAVILVGGAFVSVTGPQRTYTNTTYDRYEEANQIQERNARAADAIPDVIRDNTRPPTRTDEELQDRFDNLSDWRSGSRTGE